MKYTAVYRQDPEDQKYWLVHLAEDERCHTFATSLREARKRIVEAASFWFETKLSEEDFTTQVEVPDALDSVYRERMEAEAAYGRLARLNEKLVRKLQSKGWSMRDIGFALGLTAQRVSQISRGTR